MTADKHLAATFAHAEKCFPDLMEPYCVMLVEADPQDHVAIMRRGLRETIRRRYPMPDGFDEATDRALVPREVEVDGATA